MRGCCDILETRNRSGVVDDERSLASERRRPPGDRVGVGMNASTEDVHGIEWRPADLDAAQSEAESTGRLILVDFFSPT